MAHRQDIRKQLAEELDIPPEQIDQVVTAVHKQLKHSLPDASLLDVVQRNPQSRALFKQIQQNLFAAELVGVGEERPFTPAPTPEPATDQNIQVLEIDLLVAKLNFPEQQVRHLPDDIKDRLGLTITYNDILQFLDVATPPVTVEDIRNYFYREWKSAYDLARIMSLSDDEAWRFMVQIREQVSWSVPHAQLIKTVHGLPHQHRSPDTIARSLDLQFIARHLHLTLSEASALLTHIQQEAAEFVSNRQIINAIPFLDRQMAEPYERQFITLWEIADTLSLSMEQADEFVRRVKAKASPGATYQEILEAFNELSTQNLSETAVLDQLVVRQAARQTGMTADEFRQLPQTISEEIDAAVTQYDLIRTIHELGTGANIASIKAHYWKKQYPIPQIAVALQVPAATARSRLAQIMRDIHFPINNDEILRTVQSLPIAERTNKNIVSQIYARQVAVELHQEPQQAQELQREIMNKTGQEFSGWEIDAAWKLLPPANKTVSDLIGLLQAQSSWHKNPQETFAQIQQIRERTAEAVPLAEFLAELQKIPAPLQNDNGILNYFNLRYVLPNEKPKRKTLIRLATDITQLPQEGRFWKFVGQCPTPDNLTVREVDHLLQLVAWDIPNVLEPDKWQKERWVTSSYLIDILGEEHSNSLLPLSTERQERVTSLKTYAKRCWATICSQERQYQVPSRGKAEIIVPPSVTALINLHSIRFVQEHMQAPGLFVQFKFDNPSLIGVIRIDPSGVISGFHQLVDASWLTSLVESVALSHYRDLVVPQRLMATSLRVPGRRRNGRQANSEANHRTNKPFPMQRRTRKQYSLADWYESQEIARHMVRGHTRWISQGFVASDEKHFQAKKAGVSLPIGFTWVIEHERGNPQPTKIPLIGEDLSKHTVFTSPPQAEAELARILT